MTFYLRRGGLPLFPSHTIPGSTRTAQQRDGTSAAFRVSIATVCDKLLVRGWKISVKAGGYAWTCCPNSLPDGIPVRLFNVRPAQDAVVVME